MTADFDINAYFERIGYLGSHVATLETLAAIHRLHPQAIAFENVNPWLRWPVLLDSASLQQKLVRDGRGGYCYEHNLLFAHALRTLGFRVAGLAARVLWNAPDGMVTPRSHMLLRIDIGDETYVADVGFGGITLTAPLRLELDTPQPTPHETFRLVGADRVYTMEAEIRGQWHGLYRFTLDEHLLPDYEVANWYVSTHPSSIFVTGLIAARVVPTQRYALRNTELAVHDVDGRTERRLLTTAADLRHTLEQDFGLRLPTTSELDDALERLVASSRASVQPLP